MDCVKRIFRFWCFGLILFVLAGSVFAGTYSGGSGEPNDPFIISTAADMNEIGANVEDFNDHFLLINDINLAGYPGISFNLIGDLTTPFTGVFDGNGHTISNFVYSGGSENAIGLFRYIYGLDAEVKNLGLIRPDVNSTQDAVGGLVGWLRRGVVKDCYVKDANVSGNASVGGLAGENWGDIERCFATGNASGAGTVGVLAGNNTGGEILNCYSKGEVGGGDVIGGLAGGNLFGLISGCYSTVSNMGVSNSGGLVGDNSGTISDCFWDIESSGKSSGVGSGTSSGVTGETSYMMKKESTFVGVGWDFLDVWDIGEGQTYPYLRGYLASDLSHDGSVNMRDFAILANQCFE